MASDTCGRVSVTMLWKTVSESRMVTPETTKRTLTLITDEGEACREKEVDKIRRDRIGTVAGRIRSPAFDFLLFAASPFGSLRLCSSLLPIAK